MNKNLFLKGLNIVLTIGMLFSLAGTTSTLASAPVDQTRLLYSLVRIIPEAVDALPVAQNQAVTTSEEEAVVIHLAATDEDNDPLNYSIVAQPASGVLNGNPPNVTYTPSLDFFGQDSFTFKANDGTGDSNVATVTITVTNVNDLPVAVDDSYATALDVPLVVAANAGVLANDIDPDESSLTAILVDNVDHGILTFRDDGSFVFKPDNGFTGTDTFIYRIFDGFVLSESATATISVNLGNTPPAAVADTYNMVSDLTQTVDAAHGVLANDSDADVDDVLTAQLIGGVAFGNLTFNPDGSFVYTPNHNYIGDDHFTYQASDGEDLSIPAMVTIHVTINLNKAPVAVSDTYVMSTGTALTVDCTCGLLLNDSDENGDLLTTQLVGNPDFGSLTLNSDGSFTYTPVEGFFGQDQFTYEAFDGLESSNLVTVTILVTVNPPHQLFLPTIVK